MYNSTDQNLPYLKTNKLILKTEHRDDEEDEEEFQLSSKQAEFQRLTQKMYEETVK